jgi:hypothetical protein
MKKVVAPLVFLIGLSFSQRVLSQNKAGSGNTSPMQVGSVLINAGIGIGADYKGENYGTAFGFKVAAEFGLWDAGPGVISLGPELGGSFSSGAYYGGYSGDYNSNTFVVAGRGAWHYGWEVPGLDTYAGASAGIGFHHYSYYGYDGSNQVIPAFGGFIGGSYFIKPNFGFNAEAGFDITNFQVGVVFKIQ